MKTVGATIEPRPAASPPRLPRPHPIQQTTDNPITILFAVTSPGYARTPAAHGDHYNDFELKAETFRSAFLFEPAGCYR